MVRRGAFYQCFLALNLWSFYFNFYLCVSVCGCLFVCVPHESHTCNCPQRPEAHLGFSGTGVTMSCFTCGLWEKIKVCVLPAKPSF